MQSEKNDAFLKSAPKKHISGVWALAAERSAVSACLWKGRRTLPKKTFSVSFNLFSWEKHLSRITYSLIKYHYSIINDNSFTGELLCNQKERLCRSNWFNIKFTLPPVFQLLFSRQLRRSAHAFCNLFACFSIKLSCLAVFIRTHSKNKLYKNKFGKALFSNSNSLKQ